MNPLNAAYNRFSAHLDASFEQMPVGDRIAFVMLEETLGRRAPTPPPKDKMEAPRNYKRKSLPSTPRLVEPATRDFLPNMLRFAPPPSPLREEVLYTPKTSGFSKLSASAKRWLRAVRPAPARTDARESLLGHADVKPKERPRSWSYWRAPSPPPPPPKTSWLWG